LLQPQLRALPPGPDRGITRDTIEAELSAGLMVDAKRAGQLLVATVRAVARAVSQGEMEHVRRQLPREFQEVVAAATP
jgi:uncharacterized protein (DUF2267 family)